MTSLIINFYNILSKSVTLLLPRTLQRGTAGAGMLGIQLKEHKPLELRILQLFNCHQTM